MIECESQKEVPVNWLKHLLADDNMKEVTANWRLVHIKEEKEKCLWTMSDTTLKESQSCIKSSKNVQTVTGSWY